MIDINTYRCRIGRFSQTVRNKKSKFINKFDRICQDKTGYQALKCLQILFKIMLWVMLLSTEGNSVNFCDLPTQSPGQVNGVGHLHGQAVHLCDLPGQSTGRDAGPNHRQVGRFLGENTEFKIEKLICMKTYRKVTVNFQARYTYGNKQSKKGIKNFHLNIRSLGNKVSEVKKIIKEHHPHILGLSECELKKVGNKYDESKLKVPGYDLLFPKSWSEHVKRSLDYQQVPELQDDLVP